MLLSGGLLYVCNQQEFLLGMLFSALLILIALLDCRYLLIYDRLLIYLLVLGLLPLLAGRLTWSDACWGALLGGAVLGSLRLVSRQGMGWGDVKLAMVLGCWLGVMGICATLYIAFMAGGFYGLYLMLCRRFKRAMLVPFGPFLALGAILSFALAAQGHDLLEAWLWW